MTTGPAGEIQASNRRNDDERMQILGMLEEGRITSAEAADLLSALDDRRQNSRRDRPRGAAPELSSDRPRWFRVRVTDARTGQVRANVTIPFGMVGFGVGVARRLKMTGGAPVDDLLEAVRGGRRGTLVDVQGDTSGERVEIIVD